MPEFPISANDRRIQYTAAGGQTVFPYDFPIFADTDLTVLRTRAGVTTTLVLTADYTVSGIEAQNGGDVTLTTGATAGDVITIKGAMPVARSSDYQEGGDFRAATINRDLDRLVVMLQEQVTRLTRFLRQPDEDAADFAQLPAAASRASKFLAFDGSGQPIVAAGTSANLTPVSGFVNTLLDDASAAAFLTTLGVSSFVQQLLDETSPAALLAAQGAAEIMRAQIVGLDTANNVSDANNDIDIASGWRVSANTPRKIMVLNATLTKRLDASWTAGHNQGGLDTGAKANSTWYYLHLIGKHGLSITTRARASNVATLTFSAAHGLAVGQTIVVSGVGGGYDGVFTIAAVPLTTTVTYANTGSDEGAIAASGVADVFDALFSASATAPTMPSGYTSRSRIWAVRTDGSGNLFGYVQSGNTCLWKLTKNDVSTTTLGTTATSFTVTVPPDADVVALLAGNVSNGSGCIVWVYSPDETDETATFASGRSVFGLGSATASSQQSGQAQVKVNASGQIRAVSDTASTTLRLATYGFIYRRERND